MNRHRCPGRRALSIMAPLVVSVLIVGCQQTGQTPGDIRGGTLMDRWHAAYATVLRGEHGAAVRQLVAIYDEMPPGHEVAPHVTYWLGYCHQELGRMDEARAMYQEVLDRYPDTTYAQDARVRLAASR